MSILTNDTNLPLYQGQAFWDLTVPAGIVGHVLLTMPVHLTKPYPFKDFRAEGAFTKKRRICIATFFPVHVFVRSFVRPELFGSIWSR